MFNVAPTSKYYVSVKYAEALSRANVDTFGTNKFALNFDSNR